MDVQLREGESQEHLLQRFRQMVQRSGILREAKQKSHFTSRSEVKRIAKAKAARRQRKRTARTLTRTRKAA